MSQITEVGVDLARRVIQVHARDGAGRVVLVRSFGRERFLIWCASLPKGTAVTKEACGGAHHMARRLALMGLAVRLVAPHFVPPYRMQGASGKNDANDAAAICEAGSRPTMRFVPIKTAQTQGWQAIHRLRDGYKEERTALVNRIRSLLEEFGVQPPAGIDGLRAALAGLLEDASNELPGVLRLGLQRAQLHWIDLDIQLSWCDEQIARHVASEPLARQATRLCGVGPLTASALLASAGDLKQFKSAAQFGAWLGLVPSQHSTGGMAKLGRITKRGDSYLRTLLIQAAKSAVNTAHQRGDRLSCWVQQLKLRVGWQKAVVALANKHARILWAMLTRGQAFDPEHVSFHPT
ncbi:MAG: IS110 family transposase [Inhella sp.]